MLDGESLTPPRLNKIRQSNPPTESLPPPNTNTRTPPARARLPFAAASSRCKYVCLHPIGENNKNMKSAVRGKVMRCAGKCEDDAAQPEEYENCMHAILKSLAQHASLPLAFSFRPPGRQAKRPINQSRGRVSAHLTSLRFPSPQLPVRPTPSHPL